MVNRLSFQRLFARSVNQYFGRGIFEPVRNESAVFSGSKALSSGAWAWAGKKKQKERDSSGDVGVKEKLTRILAAAEGPLTADQVWEQAQAAGLRSKHFTKLMLQEMKLSKRVKTIPGAAKGVSFTYTIDQPAPSQETAT